MIKTCPCGVEFETDNRSKKYHDDECRQRFKQRAQRRVRLPDGMRWAVFTRDKFKCRYCGQRPPVVWLRVDHVRPIELGGSKLAMDNLATACQWCNNGKSDQDFDPELLPPADPDPHPDPPKRRHGPARRLRGKRA